MKTSPSSVASPAPGPTTTALVAPRALHRCAVLDFPDHSLNEETLDRIVAEGFTDVSSLLSGPIMPGQGFSLAHVQRLSAMAEARGLGLVLATGYMKYENELLAREPQRAMITMGMGQAADSDGLVTAWLCPFQPANLEHYRGVLEPLLRLPPLRELHLNDEAFLGFYDGLIGCYCAHCTAEYRRRTGTPPPREPDWASADWWRWIEDRMRRWTEVHGDLGAWARAIRPGVLVGIQHSPVAPAWSWQAWKTGIDLAADAKALDVLATDPYPFNHDKVVDHRPHRRILTEVTRSLAGACLGKAMHIYPQGFMPPGMTVPMGRADGLLAAVVPFALGAESVSPYNYPLMCIIPGFAEAFEETRRLDPLFATHHPYAFATVLCPLQSEMRGHTEEDWGRHYLSPFADAMLNTGLPWRWFWDGRLEDAGGSLRGPLVLPDAHALNPGQRRTIDAMLRRGGGVLRIGSFPVNDWSGTGPCPLRSPQHRGAFQVALDTPHPLTAGLAEPLMLATRVEAELSAEWRVLGRIDGTPALAIRQSSDGREAWIAGRVETRFIPRGAMAVKPTSGVELMRRLLRWLADEPPVMWMDPAPPIDEYRKLRPGDYRNAPVAELLPMVRDDSIFGLLVPYTPVGFSTGIRIGRAHATRVRRVTDRWSGLDLTDQFTRDQEGGWLPIDAPGDLDLMAVTFDLDPEGTP